MKTFKKSLAVFLAVLMLAFSVPFSALAGIADRNTPNISIQVYNYTETDLWGPYLTPEEGNTPLDPNDTLEEGTPYALMFVLNDVDEFYTFQICGSYDYDKITPAYWSKKGTRQTLNTDAFSTTGNYGANFLLDMKSTELQVAAEDSAEIRDGKSCMYAATGAQKPYWFLMGKFGFMGHAKLTGTTTIEYVYNPDAPDEYDGVYTVDGTLINLVGVQVKQEMKVSDIYSCFNLDMNDRTQNFINWANDGNAPLTFGPYEKEPEPQVQIDYEFASGSHETKNKGEEAPANTVVEKPISDNAGQHTTGYTWQEVDETHYKEVVTKEPCSMQQSQPAVDGNCSTEGKTAVMKCEECDYTTGGDSTGFDYNKHNYQKTEHEATCQADAYDEYICQDCTDGTQNHSYKDVHESTMVPHKYDNKTVAHSTDATCKTPGSVTYYCDYGCMTESAPVTGVTNPSNHEGPYTDHPQVDATCQKPGQTAYKTCQACGQNVSEPQEIQQKQHDFSGQPVETPATKKDAGKKVWTCTTCVDEPKATKEEEIPALGVNISIVTSELGSATINGEDFTETKNVPYGSSYTLVANANDGAEVIGWMSDGKLITTEATYTTTAIADTTYSPVFDETQDETFHVSFIDMYGNVIAIHSNTEIAEGDFAMPQAPTYAGMKFTEWTKSLEEVKALEASDIVYALYEVDDAKTFTVTAAGCDISVNGEAAQKDSAVVNYNDKITVTPSDGAVATLWKANGATAGYGESYSFLCGSDITITYESGENDPAPAIVSVSHTTDGTYKVKFLASRSVPADYTFIESGFVYGKDMTADDLVLENVGATKGNSNAVVKQLKNSNTAADGQFALNYGVSAMNAPATARPYIVVSKDGNVQVIYGEAMIHNYN